MMWVLAGCRCWVASCMAAASQMQQTCMSWWHCCGGLSGQRYWTMTFLLDRAVRTAALLLAAYTRTGICEGSLQGLYHTVSNSQFAHLSNSVHVPCIMSHDAGHMHRTLRDLSALSSPRLPNLNAGSLQQTCLRWSPRRSLACTEMQHWQISAVKQGACWARWPPCSLIQLGCREAWPVMPHCSRRFGRPGKAVHTPVSMLTMFADYSNHVLLSLTL